MEHIQPSARVLLEMKPMRNYGVVDKDKVLGSSPCDTLINQSEIMSWDGGGPRKYVLVTLRFMYRRGGAVLSSCAE